ncbi:type I secretion system protein [Staphylococcus argensis]|uniref:Type I secretion system protein n=1 Tax=Staphylococcus argensis TaxID=1607738 RepID=A0A2K4FC11_9STAP|nr:type I secretion system protein [Staphylococcus argensis]MCY6990245.1 type I secretion system protein [Staphylococcus argensis]POA08475.1 type I secretion system protein [Staphylococcus argensis]
MSEFLAAIAGGILSLVGTIFMMKWQFKREDDIRNKDYDNEIISMIDLVTYKAAKVRNTEFTYQMANYNHSFTSDNFAKLERYFKLLDDQLQELILKVSHHSDNPQDKIQKLLQYYEPVEKQFSALTVAFEIYSNNFDSTNRNIIVNSKRLLDQRIEEFIGNISQFARKVYCHSVYQPSLNPLVNKADAITKNNKK